LSPAGSAAVRRWWLPPGTGGADWYVSPLLRARQTAELLECRRAIVEPRLAEADWGAWEGERLTDLRARLGEEMTANESRGLDFRPPGGESPRDVQKRLTPFLRHLSERRRPAVAVTHKGVIRVIYALAAAWDMRGKPPIRLLDQCAHEFAVEATGKTEALRLNLPLLRADERYRGE
jgi:probable phosphoglycerate mutase